MITVGFEVFFQNLHFILHSALALRKKKNVLMQWHLPEILEHWTPQLPFAQKPDEPWFFSSYFLIFRTKLKPFQVHCSWFRISCDNCQLQKRRIVIRIFSSINQAENSAAQFSTPTPWPAFCVRSCPTVCVLTHNLWDGNMSLVLIF